MLYSNVTVNRSATIDQQGLKSIFAWFLNRSTTPLLMWRDLEIFGRRRLGAKADSTARSAKAIGRPWETCPRHRTDGTRILHFLGDLPGPRGDTQIAGTPKVTAPPTNDKVREICHGQPKTYEICAAGREHRRGMRSFTERSTRVFARRPDRGDPGNPTNSNSTIRSARVFGATLQISLHAAICLIRSQPLLDEAQTLKDRWLVPRTVQNHLPPRRRSAKAFGATLEISLHTATYAMKLQILLR